MKKLIVLGSMLFAGAALAQPADFNLHLQAGIYNIGIQAPPDADVTSVCIERVDVVPAVELGCAQVGPNDVVRMDVVVEATPGDDAELRGFAYDADGNKSTASLNMAVVDFTAPGAPVLIP